jgi:hypothetical protein
MKEKNLFLFGMAFPVRVEGRDSAERSWFAQPSAVLELSWA